MPRLVASGSAQLVGSEEAGPFSPTAAIGQDYSLFFQEKRLTISQLNFHQAALPKHADYFVVLNLPALD